MKRYILLVIATAAALTACAEMAERDADERASKYCAKQGKTPVPIEKEVSGPFDSQVAEAFVCIDETRLLATQPAFGADLMPDSRVRGAHIIHVSRGSYAARVGLRTNDLVYEYDGQAIGSADDLQHAVAHTETGKTVSIKWERNLTEMSGSAQYLSPIGQ
jgi:S1-C subfamily serine protease